MYALRSILDQAVVLERSEPFVLDYIINLQEISSLSDG